VQVKEKPFPFMDPVPFKVLTLHNFIMSFCRLPKTMEPPCILFHTKANHPFSFQHGYDDVSDNELKILLERCREALLSIEEESQKRGLMKVEQSNAVTDCIKKIQKTSGNPRPPRK
jgi:hypothetical protein